MKYTLEYIKEYHLKNNSICLATEYINSLTKYPYQCNCGNISKIRFSKFKQGQRCRKCRNQKISYSKRLTLEYIKEYHLKNNSICLATEYINNHNKYPYQCNCGNISKISFNSFMAGTRCNKCAIKKRKNAQKHTLEYVKNYHLDNNSVCLAKEYVNNHTKYPYICECSNQSETTLANFKNNKRCNKCNNKLTKHTIEYVKNYHLDNNSVCLAKEYINSYIKYPYICECGNQSEICFNNFKQGKRCKRCKKYKSGKDHYKWNPNREYIKLRNIISERCGNLVRSTLKSLGLKKTQKSEVLLGYTREKLYNHIINHPNWENVKNEIWHLDHIFPISAFIKSNITDIKIINALDNLQPLSKFDNLSKINKYDNYKFEQYLKLYNLKIN